MICRVVTLFYLSLLGATRGSSDTVLLSTDGDRAREKNEREEDAIDFGYLTHRTPQTRFYIFDSLMPDVFVSRAL